MTRKYTSLPYTEYLVADGRYDTLRSTIDRVVLHTMAGTAQSAINLFSSTPVAGKETSAHYGVRYDGGLIAWLEEYYTAYHCGNYAFNQRSIGIEHEDMGNYNDPRPDALYNSSAKLVADICKFYNIPCDNQHIIRHHDVQGASTACPDALDTERIINAAKQILTGTVPTDPMIQKKASRYDVIEHDDKGASVDTNKITDAEFEATRATFKNRKEGNGKWGQTCDLAGVPHSSTPQQVADKFKSMGGCNPAELAKAKEEGRQLGKKQVVDVVNNLP